MLALNKENDFPFKDKNKERKMATKKLHLLLVVFSFLFTLGSMAEDDKVVAIIGKKSLSLEEFNRRFNEVKSQALNPPTKLQFLEDLVRYKMGLQEAEKRGMDKDPLVKERMEQELYKALLEKELSAKIQKAEIKDSDMKDYYKKNPEIKSSHILIEIKTGATPQQREEGKKRAQEIYKEVKESKRPFEELVKLYTDDSVTKQNGGDVGWQSRVTLFPTYYDAILSMKEGEVKGLIETPFGFHIVKVTGRRAYENANKQALRMAVFDEKRRAAFNEYFEKLKKDYPVKLNTKLIE